MTIRIWDKKENLIATYDNVKNASEAFRKYRKMWGKDFFTKEAWKQYREENCTVSIA